MFLRKKNKDKESAIKVYAKGTTRLTAGGFQLARWALARPAFQPFLINTNRGLDETISAALHAAETGFHFSYPDLGVGICLYLIMAEEAGLPFSVKFDTVEAYLRHLRVHAIIPNNNKHVPLFLALVLHDYYRDNPPQPHPKGAVSVNCFPKVERWLTTRLLLD